MSGASGATDLSVSGGGGSTQDPNFRPSQEEESSEDSEGVFTQRSGSPDFDIGMPGDFDTGVNNSFDSNLSLGSGLGEPARNSGAEEEAESTAAEVAAEVVAEVAAEVAAVVQEVVPAATQEVVPAAAQVVPVVAPEAVLEERRARRPLRELNLNKAPDDFNMEKESPATRRSTEAAVRLYNETMKSVAEKENSQFLDLKSTPVEELPKQLSRFLMLATKMDGMALGAGSLSTYIFSLTRFLAKEHESRVDIKRDTRFKVVMDTLKSAQKESASEGATSGKHRSEPISDEHLQLLWEKKKLGRQDPKALLTAVQVILNSSLGFRANTEVYNIRNEDLVYSRTLTKDGVPSKIEVSERVTKTRQGGKGEVRDMKPTVFPDSKNPDICPVRTLLVFNRRKTEEQRQPDQPFMMSIKQSAQAAPKEQQYWFTKQRMGLHRIAQLLPDACREVGIDPKAERYTNTSIRKTLLEGGVEQGVPHIILSRVAGHKNANSLQSYVQGSKKSHNAAGLVVARKMGGKDETNFQQACKELEDDRTEGRMEVKQVEEDAADVEYEYDDGVTISQSRIPEFRATYGGGGRGRQAEQGRQPSTERRRDSTERRRDSTERRRDSTERRRQPSTERRRQHSTERRQDSTARRRQHSTEHRRQQDTTERELVYAERTLVSTERQEVTALLREVTGAMKVVTAAAKPTPALPVTPWLMPILPPDQMVQSLWTTHTSLPSIPAVSPQYLPKRLAWREPAASASEEDLVRREEMLRLEREALEWRKGRAKAVETDTRALKEDLVVEGLERQEKQARYEARLREESRRLNTPEAVEARLRQSHAVRTSSVGMTPGDSKTIARSGLTPDTMLVEEEVKEIVEEEKSMQEIDETSYTTSGTLDTRKVGEQQPAQSLRPGRKVKAAVQGRVLAASERSKVEEESVEGSMEGSMEVVGRREENKYGLAEEMAASEEEEEELRKLPAAKARRKSGCGDCEACTAEDCKVCVNCRDKPKWGGKGNLRQKCVKRTCKVKMLGKEQESTKRKRQTEDPSEQLRKRQKILYSSILQWTDAGEARPIDMFMVKPSKKIFPDYYDIIAEPIDMKTISARIRAEYYRTEEELLADCKLMFSNCRAYNEEGSKIYEDSVKLEGVLLAMAKELGVGGGEQENQRFKRPADTLVS